MTLHPSTDLVAQAWLRLAVPGVRVGDVLPATDDALRTAGFIRAVTVGGRAATYVPLRSPVVTAECWVAPPVNGAPRAPWNHAAQIAEQIVGATFDDTLMNVPVDLSSVGDYAPARVLTVIALGEPQRVPNDPDAFARFDLDLQLAWRVDA